ncbi:hypothetical protein Rmar_2336 [Rhodothermus marinus DSM 4252]|uniref:Uncharacterized protein n=2 Tax=Rhodothermus marinus TaxID=29549 RepID=D0MEI7_RHOM4|nr:hypothetical protein Rmar_2336 [Rhodothermus marinus DSM 4252]
MLALGAGGALAQRTLEIRNGKVWLDGQPVAFDLQAERATITSDLSLQLQFFGDESPVFSLNGQFFQVKGDRIVPVAPQQLFEQEIFIPALPRDTTDRMEAVMAELIEQARALQEEAERLSRSVETWRQVRTAALEEHLEALQQRAAALSEQVRLLPRLEWEMYLRHVQQQDAELARQIAEEWHWEETLQLQAMRIRQMPEGPEREQAIAELRRQLEQVFERKQENRRREIARLEQQLRLLRARLSERERYRQQIIEQRLRELLGE